jgi:signal transduction histidine kinase
MCIAEAQNVDSLKNELATVQSDTAKSRACIRLGEIKTISGQERLKYLGLGLNLALKSGSKELESLSRYHLTHLLMVSGQLDSAYYHAKKANELFVELNNSRYVALNLLELGANKTMGGDLDSAIIYQENSISIFHKLKDTLGLASAYSMLTGSFGRKGDNEIAIENALKGLKYAEYAKDNKLIGSAYTNLTAITMTQEKFDEALPYALTGLSYWNKTSETGGIARNLENIGTIYTDLGQVDSGLFYHLKAYKMIKGANLPFDMIYLSSHIGQDYQELNQLDSALFYLQQGERISREVDFVEPLANLNASIGHIYNLRKQYKKAIPYLEKAEKYALQSGSIFNQKLAYDELSYSYENLNDYKTAHFYNEKFLVTKDSLFKIESETAMAEMKTKYETDKKDLEIDVLQKQAELDKRKSARQRMLIFGSLLLAMLAGTVGYLKIRQNKLNQRLKMERFRNKVAADLHDDVGSTLSSISMYSEVIKQKAKDKLPEALPMLENMSTSSKELMDAMSDIVWTINPKNNSLNSLLVRIKLFSTELCEAKGVIFDYNQYGEIESLDLEMETAQNIYLVLKEGVNNALKYSDCKNLNLKVAVSNKEFSFKLVDDGKGFEISSSTQGNGMRTMRSRMQEVGGEFEISSNKDGTELSGNVSI